MPNFLTNQNSWMDGKRPVYLLTLDWGGEVFRFSTIPIALTNTSLSAADRDVLQFPGGLENPDFEERANRQGVSTGGTSIPFTVYLPDDVDVATEIQKRVPLSAATGELSMIIIDVRHLHTAPTYDFNNRFLLARGICQMPVYAHVGQPNRLDFSLESILPDSDSTPLVSPTKSITVKTWPSAPDTSKGRVYPTVIGTPGYYFQGNPEAGPVVTYCQGVPAYKVTDNTGSDVKLLIAGHDVVADSVRVFSENNTTGTAFDVEHITDGLGQLISFVQLAGNALQNDSSFHVSWSGGGLPNPFGPSALRGMGDVMLWALQSAGTGGLDLPKWENERENLNKIAIDCYINDNRITGWEFVRNNLLDLLALEIREGVRGIFPRVRLWGITANDCQKINEGPDFYPIGPMTTQTDFGDIRNDISIRYAYCATDGYRQGSVISDLVSGQTVSSAAIQTDVDLSMFSSSYAFISAQRYGTRSESINSRVLWEDASAALAISERCRNLGFSQSSRPYEADVTYGWLEVGDYISLESTSLGTDTGFSMAEITGKKWNGFAWEFLLTFDDDPLLRS